MKSYFTSILILINFCHAICFAQVEKASNIIHGKINVPIKVDELRAEDNFVDDRRDSKTTIENVSNDIYTVLKNIPIVVVESSKDISFSGSKNEEVYGADVMMVLEGKMNLDMNLGNITVSYEQRKNSKSGVCDYEYVFRYYYTYTNLKVKTVTPIGSKQNVNTISYFFQPSDKTELSLYNYQNIEDTKCPKRNFSREFQFKNVNESYLQKKLGSNWPYFTFNLNWDGETLKDLIEENVSVNTTGDNPGWEPPSSVFLEDEQDSEPNSVAIYFNYDNLDEVVKKINYGNMVLWESDLSKMKGVKVLNRDHINELLSEDKLHESGLVKEEQKFIKGLLKEELAIEINPDTDNKVIRCRISSKSRALEIKVENYIPRETHHYVTYFFTEHIFNEIRRQLSL